MSIGSQIGRNVLRAVASARAPVALVLASLLAYRGLKKLSLSRSGATAAWLVGFATFLSGFRFGFVLILFYQSSSSLTKFKQEKKKKLEADFKEGGQRDYAQVLSCSLIATVLALIYMCLEGADGPVDWEFWPRRSFLLCAYLGHYACCNGDTWASELGVLNTTPPFFCLPPFRRVPAGTNGGISVLGTAASLAAGLFIGFGYSLLGWVGGVGDFQVGCVLLGGAAGLGGSMLDSLMGAILQATWYDEDRKCVVPHANAVTSKKKGVERAKNVGGFDILTGEQVNALSVAVTTFASGWAGRYFFASSS